MKIKRRTVNNFIHLTKVKSECVIDNSRYRLIHIKGTRNVCFVFQRAQFNNENKVKMNV